LTRPTVLDTDVVHAWITEHPAWREAQSHLIREIETTDYPSGARLVLAQVSLAEGLDHHPIVTLGYRRVRFEVWTHDQGGVTQLDLDYAEGLDAIIDGDFAAFVR
jgi:4a-hydroxytetrahydrobiopterin dehydratase